FSSACVACRIVQCSARRVSWHGTAVRRLCIPVTSGLAWRYFNSTRDPALRSWMFPAVQIGGLLPIVLPLSLITLGSLARVPHFRLAGWGIAQAELIGALIAAAYKAITGRAHPTHSIGPDLT